MDETELRDAIAAERGELAGVLAGLAPERWDEPTLCAGWRVREVVAHMTMPYRYSTARVLLGLLRERGDINRLADRWARRDAAELPADDLAATIAANARHPWRPRGGYAGALTHDVVHGLDITVALGLGRRVPADRLRVVLDGLVTRTSLRFFGTELRGIELRADDLDWTYGSGTPVSGAGQDIALILGGRRVPAGALRGEPSNRFTLA